MATYIAYISINDTDGRSKNFSETPTVTVWNGRTKAAISSPSPTLSNITTGLYAVEIELATKTDVLFKIVPHVDDEEDIQDIKVIHEGYIETVETMGSGVTLTSAYDAAKVAASQSSVEQILSMFAETPIEIITQVADGKITAIRGNDWAIVIPCELNETAKIQMAIKYGSGLKDSNSALFVDTESGLIYLNGESANNTDGNLAYVDGNLILTVKASATAQLKATDYRYGIQSVSQANHVEEKYQGAFIVTDDIVRATE